MIQIIDDKTIKCDAETEYHIINDIIFSCNCHILRAKWTSKYYKHVEYNCEPLCTMGFNITMEIGGRPIDIDFLMFILQGRKAWIDTFENDFKLDVDKEAIPQEELV